jgi:hypothetical protein
MIKDKVIRPLVIATEKVVEYYFPEEKQEALQSQPGSKGKFLKRHSGGSTSKTTIDDGASDQDSSELSKIKRRLRKLDINSSSGSIQSPQSHKTLKKRRFR